MQNFKLNAMKIKKEQFSDRMKAIVLLLALACVNGYAQENNSSKGEDGSTSKEEGNRNVMLNAASANGPREIQIGLPSADVNVLENGIPVTYATNPHSVNLAVAVMIDNGKLPASLIVAFAQGELIDFRPVLILGKTQFERSRIEVLVNAATIEPVLP